MSFIYVVATSKYSNLFRVKQTNCVFFVYYIYVLFAYCISIFIELFDGGGLYIHIYLLHGTHILLFHDGYWQKQKSKKYTCCFVAKSLKYYYTINYIVNVLDNIYPYNISSMGFINKVLF